MDFTAFLALQTARIRGVQTTGGRTARLATRRNSPPASDKVRFTDEHPIRKAYERERLLHDWQWVPRARRRP